MPPSVSNGAPKKINLHVVQEADSLLFAIMTMKITGEYDSIMIRMMYMIGVNHLVSYGISFTV